MIFNFLILVVLLGLNAFFSALEFGLMTSKKDKLSLEIAEGNTKAKKTLQSLNKLTLFLTTAQLGITIASVLIGHFGEPAFGQVISNFFHLFISENINLHLVSSIIGTTIIVFLHMTLGEMVPKNIALAQPEKTSNTLINLGIFFTIIFKPFLLIFNSISKLFLRLIGIEQKDELTSKVSEMELIEMLGDSKLSGLVDQIEHERLEKTIHATNSNINSLIIKNEKVFHINVNQSNESLDFKKIKKMVYDTGFSRFLVKKNSLNLGYIHIKDITEYLLKDTQYVNLNSILKKIHKLPPININLNIGDSIEYLRSEKSHIAEVFDENKKSIGIITLEDLVEELIGKVNDVTHKPISEQNEQT